MQDQPREMRRRASARRSLPVTVDVQGDDNFYITHPVARSTYRYDRRDGTQVIQQGNRRLIVHYQQPLRKSQPHWLIPAGIGMIATLLLIFLISTIANWWNNWQTDQQYGLPRTYQVDAVVGHNDSDQYPSHFIFENLHGRILIMEISGGDPAHSHIYAGPTLLGAGVDKTPVTGEFDDETGRGTRDMVVHVGQQRIVYLNDGTEFRKP